MLSDRSGRKEKNQNIQVFVRLRPLNQRERDMKSIGVVEVVNNREVVVRTSQNSTFTKKFTFDRAFAPNVKQVEVYQEVVSPLIEEVLAGYNCTVFAYGQTGTGKTHTMVGQSTGHDTTWQSDPLAGIIPRALSQLFDELRLSNTEYTVRVSYLELYNEELIDLLSPSDDNSKLRIYEDVTRKGSNIVHGLEEITVSNKNEVYNIMAQGQERKRVATTLMNENSSRSHTVFTIVVHMRENSAEGEELVKIGKLNLVDLAGSENITKAGSDNPARRDRARECVTINQSLLTLGRVITALVERQPHVPYRESKLTRILQESLGGRTKTSIIATISPGHKDLEETMSTLEYAHRAKNIQNKPEVNQKMTKKAILKEYADEIDRLKRDLQATRDKNGVYLATDTFAEITLKQEEQRREIQELLLQKRAVEEQHERAQALFAETHRALERRGVELGAARERLAHTETRLLHTVTELHSTRQECEEQKHLVEVVSQTERALGGQARCLLAAADTAAGHARCLHDSVDRRKDVELSNLAATRAYREQAARHRGGVTAHARHYGALLGGGLAGLHAALEDFTTNSKTTLQEDKGKLEDILRQIHETMNEIKSLTDESHNKLASAADLQRAEVRACVRSQHAAVHAAVQRLLQRAVAALHSAQAHDLTGHVDETVRKLQEAASARVAALRGGARRLATRAQAAADAHTRATAARRDAAEAAKRHKDALVQAFKEKVERYHMTLERRLCEQMREMECEREETRGRLQAWADGERAALELRLAEHVRAERAALELRLSKKMEALEKERVELKAHMASHQELQQRQLAASAQDLSRELVHSEEGDTTARDHFDTVSGYVTEFDEGANALNADLEQLTADVVGEVDRLCRELVAALTAANADTEAEGAAVLTDVQAAGDAFVGATDAALDGAVSDNKRVVDDMIENLQAKTSTTTSTLSEVAASLATITARAEEQRRAHAAAAASMGSQLATLEDDVTDAVRALEEAEGRCLDQQYRLYSPTGKTPSRVEYRYPRMLAATSPHERILARFRAMRQETASDDCVVVGSDVEARSDESSASDDSALFLVPSPPAAPVAPVAPVAPAAPRHNTQPNLKPRNKGNQIVKSTSETNIYDEKHQDQGKENANHSMSNKRSKLPAPSSIKKPFVERNGTDN